jgi:hypothetical protein
MKREGQHGLFVYLKGGDRHFWSYYDLATGRITERKLDIIRLIQCKETTPRVEPDFDVYDVIDKVEDHIINRFRQLQVSPLTFKAPQNHILNLLQTGTVREQYEVSDLVTYCSTPLPDALLRSLRKIWDAYRRSGNLSELLQLLKTFSQANPVTPITPPTPSPVEQLQKEDLKLVCWMALA